MLPGEQQQLVLHTCSKYRNPISAPYDYVGELNVFTRVFVHDLIVTFFRGSILTKKKQTTHDCIIVDLWVTDFDNRNHIDYPIHRHSEYVVFFTVEKFVHFINTQLKHNNVVFQGVGIPDNIYTFIKNTTQNQALVTLCNKKLPQYHVRILACLLLIIFIIWVIK